MDLLYYGMVAQSPALQRYEEMKLWTTLGIAVVAAGVVIYYVNKSPEPEDTGVPQEKPPAVLPANKMKL
jgi:hypothetical protein